MADFLTGLNLGDKFFLYIAVTIITFLVWVIAQSKILTSYAKYLQSKKLLEVIPEQNVLSNLPKVLNLKPLLGYIALNIPFALALATLLLFAALLSLDIGRLVFVNQFRWDVLLFSLVGTVFGLIIVSFLINALISVLKNLKLFPDWKMDDIIFNPDFKTGKWLKYSVIALLMTSVQVLYEEILFRGLLMQSIWGATENIIASILIAGFIFGAMHFSNPETTQAKFILWSYYVTFGVIMSALAAYTGGLALPLGIHLGVNLTGAIFLTREQGAFPANSVFVIKKPESKAAIVTEILSFAGFALVAGLVMGLTFLLF